MNKKTLSILVVIAVLTAGAAYWARSSRSAPEVKELSGAKLFPGLIDKVNDVAKLEIQNKDGKFGLAKNGEAWGMADKGGYPVNLDKVKEIIVAVANMAIVEKKTAKPEYYSSLDVQDVGTPDAASTQVVLFDKDGQQLAAVLLGKPRITKAFGGQPALFVRKVGDPQAYEVTGRVWVDGNATNWLDKQAAKLEKSRVRKVETKHADASTFEIHKNVPEDQVFTITGLPEGAELKWNGVADPVAAALENWNFEDVQLSSGVDLSGATTVETTYTTWDGLVVTAKLYEKEEKAWLAVSAAFDPAARYVPAEKVGPEVPEDGAVPAPKAPDVLAKSPEDVQKEAAELNARVGQWLFAIPGYAATNFKKTVKDMVKEAAPPADPGAQPVDDGHDHELDDETVGHEDATPPPGGEAPANPPATGDAPATPPAEPANPPKEPPGR